MFWLQISLQAEYKVLKYTQNESSYTCTVHSTDVAIHKASVKEALTNGELAHREASVYLVL